MFDATVAWESLVTDTPWGISKVWPKPDISFVFRIDIFGATVAGESLVTDAPWGISKVWPKPYISFVFRIDMFDAVAAGEFSCDRCTLGYP